MARKRYFEVKLKPEVKLEKPVLEKKFQSEAEAVKVKLEKTRSEKKFQSEVKQGFSGRNFKVKQVSLLHPPSLTKKRESH